MFSPNFDDEVHRSRLSAIRACETYLKQGQDVFMFEYTDSGRAFAVTRQDGGLTYLGWDGARMVEYVSSRLYACDNRFWAEPGTA